MRRRRAAPGRTRARSCVRPSSSPTPAIAIIPWGSMKIWPSSFAADPTGRPARSYARRYQAPSQPCASIEAVIVRPRPPRSGSPPPRSPRSEAIAAASRAASTNRPAMNTDSATPPGRLGAVWNESPGLVREDVEVEAVVPVRPADQRQPVGPEAVEREVDASAARWSWSGVSEPSALSHAHGLVEDRAIAGLLDVGRHGEHEPRRVVVEPGADVVIAALGERLVLVVGAAVGQLRRGDVEDPRPRPLRDHVDQPEQVLVRVAEAHAPPDAGFEHRRRARQVERRHALVGVPGVDHPVDVLVARSPPGSVGRGAPSHAARERREVRLGLRRAAVALDRRLRARASVRPPGAVRIELAIGAGSRCSRAGR